MPHTATEIYLWVVVALTVIAFLRIGDGHPFGWIILSALQVLWMVWAVLANQMAIAVESVIFLLIFMRTYFKTRNDIHVEG